jgi:LmbE family N-acetylglucosaminyl deacetylase
MACELVASCLIVAPHPDDETIGAGIWMDRHRDAQITVLHTTDGSPRDHSSRETYAAARRRELQQAVSLAGIAPAQLRAFGYVDQESHLHLPELIGRLLSLVEELNPELILSPAYEGGHPDHDTAAAAVAAVHRRATRPFRHREYRLYHASEDGMVTDRFLPWGDTLPEVTALTPAEQSKKQRMLDCFATQRHILEKFTVTEESYRDAPPYDFGRPPHKGKLLYEKWGWPISGSQWREHAVEALRQSQ